MVFILASELKDKHIQQGDIFVNLPCPEPLIDKEVYIVKLNTDTDSNESYFQEADIFQEMENNKKVNVVMTVKNVTGIVITHNCDCLRAVDLSFCVIDNFTTIYKQETPDETKIKKWVSIITQQSRSNLKWFYLPKADSLFPQRMAVDFSKIFQLPRELLESNPALRKARLDPMVCDHFREKFALYIRNYPYNEWYPLDQNEFNEYLNNKKQDSSITPYTWQKNDTTT